MILLVLVLAISGIGFGTFCQVTDNVNLTWSDNNFQAVDMEVGNIDGDPNQEVVVVGSEGPMWDEMEIVIFEITETGIVMVNFPSASVVADSSARSSSTLASLTGLLSLPTTLPFRLSWLKPVEMKNDIKTTAVVTDLIIRIVILPFLNIVHLPCS